MKGSYTYQERQTVSNLGEELFEQYCRENNYTFTRLGFDEKNASVPNFYKLNSLIRNLPDYVISRGNETLIVNVKGTGNFKKKEVDLIPLFLEWYGTKEAPLVYAFCFKGEIGRAHV